MNTSKTVYKCCSALCVCFIRTRTSSVRRRQSTHGKFMAMKISSNHSWANSHSLLLSCRWIVFCCRAGHSVPQHIMASVECQTRHYHLIWLIADFNNQYIQYVLLIMPSNTLCTFRLYPQYIELQAWWLSTNTQFQLCWISETLSSADGFPKVINQIGQL